jgi:hypothetical protein
MSAADFSNRITAQREILRIINSKPWAREELFGLSTGAIGRWSSSNGLDPNCRLVELIRSAAGKLFFLANKSQEQVTVEYKVLSSEFVTVAGAIRAEMAEFG